MTGDGRADKAAVQMMVARLLNLREVPKPPDAADALALACCHLWRAPLAAQVGRVAIVIGSVRGTVVERTTSGEVLVEVGGVGYRVNVPLRVVPTLDPGSNTFLFTHLHVREDAMMLFGFPSRDERDTFEALIGAIGRRPEAGARDPVGAHAEHVAARSRRRRSRCADARARCRQAHRAAAARRSQGPPRGSRPRSGRGDRRRDHPSRRGARRARGPRLLAPRRCGSSLGQLARRRHGRGPPARRAPRAGRAPR